MKSSLLPEPSKAHRAALSFQMDRFNLLLQPVEAIRERYAEWPTLTPPTAGHHRVYPATDTTQEHHVQYDSREQESPTTEEWIPTTTASRNKAEVHCA